jgi:hypothetical protein
VKFRNGERTLMYEGSEEGQRRRLVDELRMEQNVLRTRIEELEQEIWILEAERQAGRV